MSTSAAPPHPGPGSRFTAAAQPAPLSPLLCRTFGSLTPRPWAGWPLALSFPRGFAISGDIPGLWEFCRGPAEPERPPAAPRSGAAPGVPLPSAGILAGEGNGRLVLGKPRLSWRNVVSWGLSFFPSSRYPGVCASPLAPGRKEQGGIQRQGIGRCWKSQESRG